MSREHKTPLRLTKAQNLLLENAANSCGQSKQAFIETAVFNYIDEVQSRQQRLERGNKGGAFVDKPSSPVNTGFAQPTSFTDAIASITNQQRPSSSETVNEATSPVQAPVVVNVGGNGASGGGSSAVGGDLIDHLASHILAGRDFEQSQRMRTAVSILADAAATDEERKTLAARLDEAVAAKKKLKSSESTSFARMAFNKLSHLLSE